MRRSFSALKMLPLLSLFLANGQAGRGFKFVPGRNCGVNNEIKITLQTAVDYEVLYISGKINFELTFRT